MTVELSHNLAKRKNRTVFEGTKLGIYGRLGG